MTQKAEYNAQPDRQGKGMGKGQVKSQISKGVVVKGLVGAVYVVTKGTNSTLVYRSNKRSEKTTRSHIETQSCSDGQDRKKRKGG